MKQMKKILSVLLVLILILSLTPVARADYYSDWVSLRNATVKSMEDLMRLYISPEVSTKEAVKIAINTYNTIKYSTINSVNIVAAMFEIQQLLINQIFQIWDMHLSQSLYVFQIQKMVYEKARKDEDSGLSAISQKSAIDRAGNLAKTGFDDVVRFVDEFLAAHPVFITLNPKWKNVLNQIKQEAIRNKPLVPNYYLVYLEERAAYAASKSNPAFTYRLTNERSPSGTLLLGQSFGLRGDITSTHPISSLTAQVLYASNGAVATSKTIYPNASSATIYGTINNAIIFNNLPVGDYVYRVQMHIAALNRTVTIISSNFTVASAAIPVLVTMNSTTKERLVLGESVEFELATQFGDGPVTYRFEILRDGTVMYDSGFTTSSYMLYQPPQTGVYVVRGYAKDNVQTDYLDGIPVTVGLGVYDMSAVKWIYTSPFEYDGQLKQVQLTGLPNGVSVSSYEFNTAKAPGTYTAIANLTFSDLNYQMPSVPNLTWVINGPTAPALLLSQASNTSIRASWQATLGASGYELWRAPINSKEFVRVYRGQALSYTDKNTSPGAVYSYRLRAYAIINGVSRYGSNGSIVSTAMLAKPALPSAVSYQSGKGIKVTWPAIAGAMGYELWRSKSGATSNKFERVYRGNAVSFADTNVVQGDGYHYKVRAYVVAGDRSFYGPSSSVRKAVPISKIQFVHTSPNSNFSLSVQWDGLPNVTGYELWRSEGESGLYTRVLRANVLNRVDTGLTPGNWYAYKVRAYKVVDSLSYYGAFSESSHWIALVPPGRPSAQVLGANSIQLTWPVHAGATSYVLAKHSYPWDDVRDMEESVIYEGKERTYTDKSVNPGEAVVYRLSVVNRDSGTGYGQATLVVPLAKPTAPQRTVLGSTGGSLTWEAIDGATGYELWRAEGTSTAFSRVYRGSARSYTDTGLSSGQTYTYKLRAYAVLDGKSHYGAYSAARSLVPLSSPGAPAATTLNAGTGLSLSWGSVAGATGYELFRAPAGSENFTRVYRGTATSYTNTGLSTGQAYNYRVRAYKVVDGVSHYGPYSALGGGVPIGKADIPRIMAVDAASVRVGWSVVPGAAGYELWRAPAGGSFVRVYRGSAGSFTDSKVSEGLGYTYRIRAYRDVDGSTYYGSYGAGVAVTPR